MDAEVSRVLHLTLLTIQSMEGFVIDQERTSIPTNYRRRSFSK